MKNIDQMTGKVHHSDCTSLMKKLPDASIQMVFADPPFNLKKKYNSYKDDMEFADYISWTSEWLEECGRILREDGSLFLYNIPRVLIHTTSILNEFMEFRHWIAWNSNGKPLGKTLQPAHYGILFYTKTRTSKFFDVRAPHQKCRKCHSYLRDYGGKAHLRHPFGYQISDVWSDIHRTRHQSRRIDNHPCQLPVHLIERLILMTTDEGDIIFDPFSGGGSAAVASRQLGRKYIGCDIDREYADAANSRYSESTKTLDENGKFVSIHLGQIVSMRNIDIKQ